MYILTNVEAEVTHKVLKNAGPSAGNELPEAERKTLKELIEKLGTSIDNGLPEDGSPDNSLPAWGPPTVPGQLPTGPGVDNTLPGSQPGVDNTLPGQPTTPDNTLPGSQPGPDNTLPGGPPTTPGNELPGTPSTKPTPTPPATPKK